MRVGATMVQWREGTTCSRAVTIQETLPARLKAVPSRPPVEARNSLAIRARDTSMR
jgi:hypothetical protein